ncbi:glycosyltransferase [Candidatus Woesearchaeota archaeon]|nr:glycosyltransferase [Candidatus Woesearchaeota archaeon]
MKITAITSYPPLQSGIARYSHSLYSHLSQISKVDIFRWNYDTHFARLKAPLEQRKKLEQIFAESDIVHIQYVLGEYMFAFLPVISSIKKNSKAKLVMTLHEDYQDLPFSKRIISWHNKMYNCADLLLVHTSVHRTLLGDKLFDKTLISPFGVRSVEPVGPVNTNTVLLIGFINPWKGHDIAIKAIYHVKKQIPDIKLKMIGKAYDKKYSKKIEQMITSLGLTNNIELITDYVPDEQYDQYISSSEIAIMPYQRITMSAVLSDIIAFNKPCILSDLEAFKEYTQDLALYFPNGDSRLLARRITSLLSDSQERNRISSQFKRLSVKYSWENVAQFTYQEYKRILSDQNNFSNQSN